MTDIDKLIEELRNLAALAPSQKYRVAFTSAADTIAAQSARIEELEAKVRLLDREHTASYLKGYDDAKLKFKALKGGSDNG